MEKKVKRTVERLLVGQGRSKVEQGQYCTRAEFWCKIWKDGIRVLF